MTGTTSRRTLLAGAVAAPFVARGALAQQPAGPPPPPGSRPGQAPITGPQLPPPAAPLHAPYPVMGSIERLHPSLDALIDVNSPVEKVMDGFSWIEGPVWVGGADGYLLCSDVKANRTVKWSPKTGGEIWLSPAGFDGKDNIGWDPDLSEPGANGLILARGGIVACDSGGRRVLRFDLKTKKKTVLVERFDGKRFNSPNDAVLHPNGTIYFTDPSFGLRAASMNPNREMDYMAIWRIAPDNTVTLFDKMTVPNGIGLSPDATKLYGTDTNGWNVWDLDKAGNGSNRRIFVGADKVRGGDGLKIDAQGNMWAASRDGISIFNPAGERIGIIKSDQVIANCAFGADGYLYMTSNIRLLRVKVKAKGIVRSNI